MLYSPDKGMNDVANVLESDYGLTFKTNKNMENKSYLLRNFIAQHGAMFDDVYNPYYQERVRRGNEEHRKKKAANIKRIAEINKARYGERALSKFVIKGHEIEAYSRKDAIIKLKHQGLI